MLCILHWSLCVYREFRSIWLALEAVAFIPTSRQTKMGENSIQSLWLALVASIPELFMYVLFLNYLKQKYKCCGIFPPPQKWWRHRSQFVPFHSHSACWDFHGMAPMVAPPEHHQVPGALFVRLCDLRLACDHRQHPTGGWNQLAGQDHVHHWAWVQSPACVVVL